MNSTPLLEADDRILAARAHWEFRGQRRPDFADATQEGQESVWDYPRPPCVEPVSHCLRVEHHGKLIAETTRGVGVCETASAPTYYFPPEDIIVAPREGTGSSIGEWRGISQPLDIEGVQNAAWRYVRVFPEFEALQYWVAFYPNRLECFIRSERVGAQPGGYYGGWVAGNMTGPIKGGPGSGGW